MASAYDKHGNSIAKGDMVVLTRYTDELLKGLPSAGPRQAVIAAVGRRFAAMSVRTAGGEAEVLLRLPPDCGLAHSGGYLVWLNSKLLEK